MKTAEQILSERGIRVPGRQPKDYTHLVSVMQDYVQQLLPTDEETRQWFEENIDTECSASVAVYKFRLYLNHRLKQL